MNEACVAATAATHPSWMLKAETNKMKVDAWREARDAELLDSEFHENMLDDDEYMLCNSFVCHDPGQRNDKSEFWKSWQNFREDRSRPATTILDDLPTERRVVDNNRRPSRNNPMSGMSTRMLTYLASTGDQMAIDALKFRSGKLARRCNAELIVEYGERQANGHLLKHTRYIAGKQADDIREIFG
jgi:hypothetical protein